MSTRYHRRYSEHNPLFSDGYHTSVSSMEQTLETRVGSNRVRMYTVFRSLALLVALLLTSLGTASGQGLAWFDVALGPSESGALHRSTLTLALGSSLTNPAMPANGADIVVTYYFPASWASSLAALDLGSCLLIGGSTREGDRFRFDEPVFTKNLTDTSLTMSTQYLYPNGPGILTALIVQCREFPYPAMGSEAPTSWEDLLENGGIPSSLAKEFWAQYSYGALDVESNEIVSRIWMTGPPESYSLTGFTVSPQVLNLNDVGDSHPQLDLQFQSPFAFMDVMFEIRLPHVATVYDVLNTVTYVDPSENSLTMVSESGEPHIYSRARRAIWARTTTSFYSSGLHTIRARLSLTEGQYFDFEVRLFPETFGTKVRTYYRLEHPLARTGYLPSGILRYTTHTLYLSPATSVHEGEAIISLSVRTTQLSGYYLPGEYLLRLTPKESAISKLNFTAAVITGAHRFTVDHDSNSVSCYFQQKVYSPTDFSQTWAAYNSYFECKMLDIPHTLSPYEVVRPNDLFDANSITLHHVPTGTLLASHEPNGTTWVTQIANILDGDVQITYPFSGATSYFQVPLRFSKGSGTGNPTWHITLPTANLDLDVSQISPNRATGPVTRIGTAPVYTFSSSSIPGAGTAFTLTFNAIFSEYHTVTIEVIDGSYTSRARFTLPGPPSREQITSQTSCTIQQSAPDLTPGASSAYKIVITPAIPVRARLSGIFARLVLPSDFQGTAPGVTLRAYKPGLTAVLIESYTSREVATLPEIYSQYPDASPIQQEFTIRSTLSDTTAEEFIRFEIDVTGGSILEARSVLANGVPRDGYVLVYGRDQPVTSPAFTNIQDLSYPNVAPAITDLMLLSACIRNINADSMYLPSGTRTSTVSLTEEYVVPVSKAASTITSLYVRVPNQRLYSFTSTLTLSFSCPQDSLDLSSARLQWVQFMNSTAWPNVANMGAPVFTALASDEVSTDGDTTTIRGTGTPSLVGEDYFISVMGFVNQPLNANDVKSCVFSAVFDYGTPTEATLSKYEYPLPLPDPYITPGLVVAWFSNPSVPAATGDPDDESAAVYPHDTSGFLVLAHSNPLYIRIETPRDIPTHTTYRHVVSFADLLASASADKPWQDLHPGKDSIIVTTLAEDVSDSQPLELVDTVIEADHFSFALSREVIGVKFTIVVNGLWLPPPGVTRQVTVQLTIPDQDIVLCRTRTYLASRYSFAQYAGTVARTTATTQSEVAAIESEPSADASQFAWPSIYGAAGFASIALQDARQRAIQALRSAGLPPLARAYYASSSFSLPYAISTGNSDGIFAPKVVGPIASQPARLVFQFDFPPDVALKVYDDQQLRIDIHFPAAMVPHHKVESAIAAGLNAIVGISVSPTTYLRIANSNLSVRYEPNDLLPMLPTCQSSVEPYDDLSITDCASAINSSLTTTYPRPSTILSFILPKREDMADAGLAEELLSADQAAKPYWRIPYSVNASNAEMPEMHTLTFFVDSSVVVVPSPEVSANMLEGQVVVHGIHTYNSRLTQLIPSEDFPNEGIPYGWSDSFENDWLAPTPFHFPISAPAVHNGLPTDATLSIPRSLPLSIYKLDGNGANAIDASLTGPGASSMRLDVLTSSTLSVDSERLVNAWPSLVAMANPPAMYAVQGSPYNVTFELVPSWTSTWSDFSPYQADPSIPVPGAWTGTELLDLVFPEGAPPLPVCPISAADCQDLKLVRSAGLALAIQGQYSVRTSPNSDWGPWTSIAPSEPLESVGTWRNQSAIVIPLIQALPSKELLRAALTGNLRLVVQKLVVQFTAPLALQRALVRGLPQYLEHSNEASQVFMDETVIYSSNAGGSADGPLGAGDVGIEQSNVFAYTIGQLKTAIESGDVFVLPPAANVLSGEHFSEGVDFYSYKRAAYLEVCAQRLSVVADLAVSLANELEIATPLDDPDSFSSVTESAVRQALHNIFVQDPIPSAAVQNTAAPPVQALVSLDRSQLSSNPELRTVAPLLRTAIPRHVATPAADAASAARPIRIASASPAAIRLQREDYSALSLSRTSPIRAAALDPPYSGAEDVALTIPLELAGSPSRVSFSGKQHYLVITAQKVERLAGVTSAHLTVVHNDPLYIVPALLGPENPLPSPTQGNPSVWPLRIIKKVQEYLVLELPVSEQGEHVEGFAPSSVGESEEEFMNWPVLFPGAVFNLTLVGFLPQVPDGFAPPSHQVHVSVVDRNAAPWLNAESPDLPPALGHQLAPAGLGVFKYAEAASNWIDTPTPAARDFPRARISLTSVHVGSKPSLELRLQMNSFIPDNGWQRGNSLVLLLPSMTTEALQGAAQGSHGALLPGYSNGVPAATSLQLHDPVGWCFRPSAHVASLRWNPTVESAPTDDPGTVDLTDYVDLALFTRVAFATLTDLDTTVPSPSENPSPTTGLVTSSVFATQLGPGFTAHTYYERTNNALQPFFPSNPSDEWAATPSRLTVAILTFRHDVDLTSLQLPPLNSYVSITFNGLCPVPPHAAPRLPVEARLISTSRMAVTRTRLVTRTAQGTSSTSPLASLELPYSVPFQLSNPTNIRQNLTFSSAATKLRMQARLAALHWKALIEPDPEPAPENLDPIDPEPPTDPDAPPAEGFVVGTQSLPIGDSGLPSTGSATDPQWADSLATARANVVYESSRSVVSLDLSYFTIDLPPTYIPVTTPELEQLLVGTQPETGVVPVAVRCQLLPFASVVAEAQDYEYANSTMTPSEQQAVDFAQQNAPSGAVATSLSYVSRVMRAWDGVLRESPLIASFIATAIGVRDPQTHALLRYTIRIPTEQLISLAVSQFGTTNLPGGTVVRLEIDAVVNPASTVTALKLSHQTLLSSKRFVNQHTAVGSHSDTAPAWEDWLNPHSLEAAAGANLLPIDVPTTTSSDNIVLTIVNKLTGGASYYTAGPPPLVLLHDFSADTSVSPASQFSSAVEEAEQVAQPIVLRRESTLVVTYGRTSDGTRLITEGEPLRFEILTTVPPLPSTVIHADHTFRDSGSFSAGKVPTGSRLELRLPQLWISSSDIYEQCTFSATLSVNDIPMPFLVSDMPVSEWQFTNIDRITRSYTKFLQATANEGVARTVTYLSPPTSSDISITPGAAWKLAVRATESCIAKVPSPDATRDLSNASVFLRILAPASFSSIISRSLPAGSTLSPLYGNNLAAIVPPSLGSALLNGWTFSLSSYLANSKVAMLLQFTTARAIPPRSTFIVTVDNGLAKQMSPDLTFGFRFASIASPYALLSMNAGSSVPWLGIKKPKSDMEAAEPFATTRVQLQTLQNIPASTYIAIEIPDVLTPTAEGVYDLSGSGNTGLVTLEILSPSGNYLLKPTLPVAPTTLTLVSGAV